MVNIDRRGEEVPVHEDVQKLFNVVLDDLKVHPKLRKTYKTFTIFGFDTYNAGINDTKFGVIIGIPSHFVYKDKKFVDLLEIRIGYDRQPLNPYEPATEDLAESLVLSDKAKKYGIAREILMSQKNLPLYRSLESPLIISSTAMIAEMLKNHFKILQKPFIVVFFAYFGLGLGSFATWFQLRDSLNTYFEGQVDKQLAKLGPDYVEGGKEFYAKLLKRNMAIRRLMGSEGKRKFNSHGDEINFMRQKRIPLSQRKKFFEDYNLSETIVGQPLNA